MALPHPSRPGCHFTGGVSGGSGLLPAPHHLVQTKTALPVDIRNVPGNVKLLIPTISQTSLSAKKEILNLFWSKVHLHCVSIFECCFYLIGICLDLPHSAVCATLFLAV